jgi:hypothetical protein
MTFQFLIIFLQCAALAAFLILWYFWVKKKMETSFILEEDDRVLFPFKYFSWILMGLVFVTCLVQIHFIRVSSSVHEKMASFLGACNLQEQQARAIDDMKALIDRLRKDMDSNFRNLHAQNLERPLFKNPEPPAAVETRTTPKASVIPIHAPKAEAPGFAKEAKASSAAKSAPSPQALPKEDKQDQNDERLHSMPLSRTGRAVVDNLLVRKRPQPGAAVVDKITTDQVVKVTEKREINETIWFHVVTPSGKAGWVNYRYLKLEGNA